MFNLRDIINWKKNLGLLPINLHHNTDYNRYILQNGGTSDFCLSYEEDKSEEEYYSLAWSSNTKNFLSFKDNDIKIFNWKKREPELVSLNTVENNFTKFYDYLVSNSFKSENDIVPFVLNIYRKLRNYLNEKNSGKESLNSIFLLFAAYEEQKSVNEIDIAKWGIESIVYKNERFEKYLHEFSNGLDEYVKPNVELIIRHASGALFQEAHQEALFFNKNLDLFSGTLSSDYKANKLLYSSIHYTPSFIARIIVEQTLQQVDLKKKKVIKILDPACGTSQFAMETLKQLKSNGFNGKVDITGFDNSETAINTSNFLLTYERREWGDKLDFKFYLVEDSLKINWGFDYDIIFMNPPFISWEQMTKDYRDAVRDTLDNFFEKRPNQASAFFIKAIKSLNKEGAIGCVLPSSIFTLDSYKKLRNALSEMIKTNLLGKLGNFVFENALTDISFYIGSKKTQDNFSPIFLWTSNEKGVASKAIRNLRIYNSSNKPVINSHNFSIYRPIKFPITEDSWKTLSYEEHNLLKKLETYIKSGDLVRIKDVFSVKQGVRTGNNNVFKITKNYFNNLPNLA